ncbi:MAG TPA: LpqB family beta-propeller domain-containing protein [Mycobacteriales bacterium]|jgi:hypothetical protein|nr:LpqB family beta-propeller domain-containing protein [Mycobacteriales bacterium]
MTAVQGMTRRRGVGVVGLALLAVLGTGCGLPLQDGVRRPGDVPAEQRLPQPINVLPPGPQPGATPEDVVQGFLAAQSSARDQHGIARSFLLPAARPAWRADAGVTVYDPRTAAVGRPQPDADGVTVALSIDVLGTVGPDGAARVQPPQPRTQRYRLRQDGGQWRLSGVPEGLTLSPAGRDRSYDPVSVYFLAPLAGTAVRRHLVADLVALPTGQDRAQQVVDRLLAGPSSGLADSGQSAVPAGARLRSGVVTSAAGEVTVDLGLPPGPLSGTSRADLSAQLVWTLKDALPDFTRLRLLVDGTPLQVPGVPVPQPRNAWESYVPDGPDDSPGLALVDGRVRPVRTAEEDDEPLELAQVAGAVDLAVDARTARLAVLTSDGATTTLRSGPLAGPLAQGVQDPGLRSPTWGSGDLGVFLLRTGPRPAVLLVPAAGGAPVELQVEGLPALDGDAVLRVSRDGARVALVADGVLQVGRLQLGGRVPRLVALRRLATGVLDVAWRTGTTLEVLVQDDEPPLLPLLHLSVDGTSASSSGLVGVAEGTPRGIAADGDQPMLVETRAPGRSTVYSGDGSTGFQVQLAGATRPAYAR